LFVLSIATPKSFVGQYKFVGHLDLEESEILCHELGTSTLEVRGAFGDFPPIMEGFMELAPFEVNGAASIGRRAWYALFGVVAGASSLCPAEQEG